MEARGATIIGYKVAAAGAAAQQALGLPGPVVGILYDGGALNSPALISAGSMALPIFEADMLMRISDPAIINATTHAEALAGLDAVIPMIEVADALIRPPEQQLNGPLLVAINAAGRFLITGDDVPVEQTQAFADSLAQMTVRLTLADGTVLTEGTGAAIMDHPLNSVLFAMEQARERGWPVEAGMLLSLGTIGRLHPVRPGIDATLTYEGLPRDPAPVHVQFVE